MNLPAFLHHSPALQVPGAAAPFDYGRALSLREMARRYTVTTGTGSGRSAALPAGLESACFHQYAVEHRRTP